MADQQSQKNKKSKKKSKASSEPATGPSSKDVEVPLTLPTGSNKQQAPQHSTLGNSTVTATDVCQKETVDDSASKKKKKAKKKSKEVLKETFAKNNNTESLLNFSPNGIHLLNHPEISVTISDSTEAKGTELKTSASTDKAPVSEEKEVENNAAAPAAVASKKKKKKKKNKANDDANLPVTTTAPSETTVPTPTYTKVVTGDNTCVLVVNNEKISVDPIPKENSGAKTVKISSKNKIDFSLPPEKQFGDVLLTKKISSDTSVQFSNSVSIFPVLTNAGPSIPNPQPTIDLEPKSEGSLIITKISNNEDTKENVEEAKTKSQLKAERRAKQEAQRAAKLAKSNEKPVNPEKTGSSAKDSKTASPKGKSLPKENASKATEEVTEKTPAKLPAEKESVHKVKLFSQLPQCKKFDINAKIHPAILEIGFQYNKGIICGSNARCVALLDALKEVIKDYAPHPERNFYRDLESSIQSCLAFLSNCRPLSVSMINAVRFLKHEINRMPSDLAVEDIKERLFEFINNFVKEDILIARKAIGNCASYKIVDGDVILVFAFSSLVRDVLCKARNKNKMFRVVVVDSRPKLEGLQMLRYLVKQGLHCSYISINAISYIMKEVSKVILGAHALLSNGYVVSRLGNKQIALVASAYDVPVFVCCESYKLCERVLTDSFVHNELGEPSEIITASPVPNDSLKNWHSLPSLQPLNLLYDVTSPDLISEIITEKGALPCTSVPVILRVKYGGMSQ